MRFRCPRPRRPDAAGPARSGQRRVCQTLPAFSWSAVPGAESYQFQVAADQNFNSPVLGQGEGSFTTKNTRATLKKTLPNGTLLVASPGDVAAVTPRRGRRPRVDHQGVDGVPASQTPVAGLPVHLPDRPRSRRLVAGSVRRELPLLARERSRPREHRRGQRSAGRDLGDELRADASTLLPSGTTTGTSSRSTPRATAGARRRSRRSTARGRR